MKFLSTAGAVLLPLASFVGAIEFDADDEASIRSVSAAYAHGLMSSYKNNGSQIAETEVGVFPKPHYWWFSGAVWGGLVEFTNIFDDNTYVKNIQQALTANYGPNNDIILPWKKDQEGNDDQAFWALAVMSALEYNFPNPDNAPATYLEVAENAFKNIVGRWDTEFCGGGLRWQIYPENDYGYSYKNSISNGATFALGARLARYTGKQEYADWAVKIYDWTKKVGLIGDDWQVYDGTGIEDNCASIADKTEWTYNNAMFLHGSAFMYDYTNKDDTWKDRTKGFLERAGAFFKNPSDVEDVMFEVCEPSGKCNLDQYSFKAYLSRWMAKTAILAPFTKDKVTEYLKASAEAAAKVCGDDGSSCPSRWYTSHDGLTGLGQQLSALEVTQALLHIKQGTLPSKAGGEQPKPSSSAPATSSKSETPSATEAPSSTNSEPAPSTSESQAAPSTDAAPVAPSATSSSAAGETSATPGAPAPTGGEFAQPSSGNGSCSCTKKIVTVWVPPTGTAPVAPPATPVVTPPYAPPANSSVPGAPPANSTTPPEQFPGAASSVKLAGSTLFAAAAVAALAAFL
ncbi:glycoside hydrolase family 76 protein [Lentithecium fluviatile CBS 122367]|uniref:mannan endo-1,6-alpha-mannosidase n=1 Tax=Lentithecium fluviatile CBS 122367 TaxID=1168545 RepID=A0A6G1JI27_9PLEO|nr:glycoside hydrolase family 76 protein [Lentithecium fluviatile CBS 122367]